MLGMSVSGKTAIGQVVSGVRLIHDEKKVKRMLEAQKMRNKSGCFRRIVLFFERREADCECPLYRKYEKNCTNKSRKEFDFWINRFVYITIYNIGVTRKNLTKPLC